MSEEPASRNYLTTVLGCYCPRCREGKLFKNPSGQHLVGGGTKNFVGKRSTVFKSKNAVYFYPYLRY